MSSDDYQVQNISRYCRKTYKKKREAHENDITTQDLNIDAAEMSPRSDARSDGIIFDPPVCSCELDAEGEIANIIHKKCPVITLAQQQLQRLLDETDKMLCDNTGCCRPTTHLRMSKSTTGSEKYLLARRAGEKSKQFNFSIDQYFTELQTFFDNQITATMGPLVQRSVYDFLCVCREILVNQNKCRCVLLILLTVAFFLGLLTGAASCGSYLGRFNSPILTCIDNYFIPTSYANIEDTYRSIV